MGTNAVALEAWNLLNNNISEEDIEAADVHTVATIMAVWTYFGQHWERGVDGPT